MRRGVWAFVVSAALLAESSAALAQSVPLKGRKAPAPKVKIGRAISTGAIDKSIIRRRVRRYEPAVRHCYEEQLRRAPTLGKNTITAELVIKDGRVMSVMAKIAANRTAEWRTVASCIARVVYDMTFPFAVRDGVVKVRYPFELEPDPKARPNHLSTQAPLAAPTRDARLDALRAILATKPPPKATPPPVNKADHVGLDRWPRYYRRGGYKGPR